MKNLQKTIIFIHLLNDTSGSPKVLSEVIRTAKDNGYKTILYTSNSTQGFLNGVADEEHFFNYRRSDSKYTILIRYLISQACIFWFVLNYRKLNCLFYINTILPFGGALAAKCIGKKVVYHLHESSLTTKWLYLFLQFFVNLTADKIIYVSNYLKSSCLYKCSDGEIIYNPSPALQNNLSINDKLIDNGYFNILMVSSLKGYKGIFEFVEIARKMEADNIFKFHLVLNADLNEIHDFFDSISLPSNLKIFERQLNVERFYKSADLVMNLTRHDEVVETFGMTLVEAMSFGVPVIAPPIGGPTEIITDSVDGFLLSCYDQDEIERKIYFLQKNKVIYKTFSDAAFKKSQKFSLSQFRMKILNSLRDLLR
jgi:glycosyltransferase involved in cell wall biosynthesis